MRKLTVIVALVAAQSPAALAQEVGPAAIAFSTKNPITTEMYIVQAHSYLAVKNNLLAKLPANMHAETRIRAREFAAFTAGLFATYNAEQTLSCLSWQSFDDVVARHAKLAASSQKVEYPMLGALINLKFACFTKQESEALSKAFKENQARDLLDKQP